MIPLLKRIIEQSGAEGQFYDLGKDFSSFRRMIDGADQQIRQQYEKIINSKLVGKRVRALASRGYKQYVRNYEFDVSKITLDDYYDNFVVVAHDSTTPKAKEYFLKPGFKIQVLGPATGERSPQRGNKPEDVRSLQHPSPIQPKQEPDLAQHQPAARSQTDNTSETPVKEMTGTEFFDAYSIDQIVQDIKSWIPKILIKPETSLRDFIKSIGWQRNLGRGVTVALYDLKIPSDSIKNNIGVKQVKNMIIQSSKMESTISIKYDLVKMEPDNTKGIWNIRIKKTTTDKNV